MIALMLIFSALGMYHICLTCQREEISVRVLCAIVIFSSLLYAQNWIGELNITGATSVMENILLLSMAGGVVCLCIMWFIGVDSMAVKKRRRRDREFNI